MHYKNDQRISFWGKNVKGQGHGGRLTRSSRSLNDVRIKSVFGIPEYEHV